MQLRSVNVRRGGLACVALLIVAAAATHRGEYADADDAGLPSGEVLFVPDQLGGRIRVVDLQSGQEFEPIAVRDAPLRGIAIDRSRELLFVATDGPDESSAGTVRSFPTALPGLYEGGSPDGGFVGEAVGALPAGARGLRLQGSRGWLYSVGENAPGTLSILDLASPESPHEIEVGGRPTAVWIDNPGDFAFVVDAREGTVKMVSLADDAIVATTELGRGLADIQGDSERGLVYISQALASRVLVLDARSLAFVAELPVGGHPYALSISASGRLLVANFEDGSVSVIDTSANQVLTTIPTVKNPYAITLSADGASAVVIGLYSQEIQLIDVAELHVRDAS